MPLMWSRPTGRPFSLRTVSYTHLDVYKRQAGHRFLDLARAQAMAGDVDDIVGAAEDEGCLLYTSRCV